MALPARAPLPGPGEKEGYVITKNFYNLKDLCNLYEQREYARTMARNYQSSTQAAKAEALTAEIEALSACIDAEIKAAEGRAQARRIKVNDILWSVNELNRKLACAKKKNLEGAHVWVSPHHGTPCNAYQRAAHGNAPDATQFRLDYKRGNWRLTDIYRTRMPAHRYEMVLPEEAKKDILASFAVFD